MAHIHELIDWTAGVYIVHKNKVLLRLHEKYKIWIHVGGHVELNEDPITAAKRECLEEVGLTVHIFGEENIPIFNGEPNKRELSVPAHMNIHYVGGTEHQHIDLLYYATSDNDHIIPENSNDQWMWLTKEEIETNPNLLESTKYYALGALQTLGK